MPAVTVPRTGITASDVKAALAEQLGSRYTVVEKGADRLRVSTSAASSASVRLSERPGGTHLAVHGGGIILGRIVNEFLIARTVAKALKASPQLQSAG